MRNRVVTAVTRRGTSVVVGVGVTWLAVAALALAASAARTVWDGVYTKEQATRGRTLYMQECAACHGEDLISNTNAPSLIGTSFSFVWNDTSVGEFLERTRKTMPSDRPNELATKTYLDIIAFTLQSNGYPPGEEELTGELDTELKALNEILITAPGPDQKPH